MPPSKGGQGQWALGHREPLNPTSAPNATTTASPSVTAFSPATPTRVSTRSTRSTFATGSAGGGCTHSGGPAYRGVRPPPSSRTARGLLLHAARTDGRRPADQPAAAHRGRNLPDLRPGRRRRHRPAERAAALDSDRGRPRDSGAGWRPSGCRAPRRAGTSPGSILGCPLAGISADEIIDATPVLQETVER